ncbi:general secretion pathway protein GspK [Phragmitibacter flavus]|uniref:general secretion pathway protein GspK n=1 Tax=Phragmitibacter flavus TaxID=2576071 RepID=UPI00140D3C60|nr:type II secretion system protein GspK [Phragmitibacter flavus]
MNPRSARASALLVVLWVVAFLSFLVVTGMMVTSQEMESLASRKLASRARHLAEMGLAVAAHPRVESGQSILTSKLSELESYEARKTSEEGRLNLNAFLTEERRGVLEQLFQGWGLQPAEAQTLVNAMMDWVDADDLPRLNSAEKAQYLEAGFPGRPTNRPFRSLDEVELVAGMETLAAHKPDWRESFTLWGRGRLDINAASAELLAVVTGLPSGAVEMIVRHRAGPDGIAYTNDDTPFKDIDDFLELLGLSGDEDERRNITDWVTVEGHIKRVESVGRIGDYSRGIVVVVKDNGTKPEMLEWREFVIK